MIDNQKLRLFNVNFSYRKESSTYTSHRNFKVVCTDIERAIEITKEVHTGFNNIRILSASNCGNIDCIDE